MYINSGTPIICIHTLKARGPLDCRLYSRILQWLISFYNTKHPSHIPPLSRFLSSHKWNYWAMNVTLFIHHTTGVVRDNFDVNWDKTLSLPPPPPLSLLSFSLSLSHSLPPHPLSLTLYLPSSLSLSHTYTQVHWCTHIHWLYRVKRHAVGWECNRSLATVSGLQLHDRVSATNTSSYLGRQEKTTQSTPGSITAHLKAKKLKKQA